MAILLLGTTIGGYAAIHAGNIASQSVNYANTSGSTTGSATSLLSPNGATVVAADSAMPASGHSFIHTLAQGPGGNDGHILGMTWAATNSVYGAQIFLDTDPNDIMAIRSRSNAGVWTSWKTVIHSGTIGSQSVSYATTAGGLTSMNISQFINNSGYLTAETDTLASVTARGSTTTTSITAERYRGNNSLILNAFTTVNPSSNVFLYSQANDRDSWIYLDSADTGSNWGIYHRQIDSAVGGMEGNSIGFIGGGASALRAYIGLSTGNAYFAGTMSAAGHLFASYNGSNILLKSADNASDAGILLQNSGGSFKFQVYGNGTDYGFLNGAWAAWDIRKTIGGAMYMNNDSTYYLSTSSTSNFYALNIQSNAVIHAGNIGSQSVNYATTAGSAPNGSNVNNYYDATAGNGFGFRFWNGSDAYKISMGASSLYYYGPVTDYSIKMQMNDGDTGRGFTWGRVSYAPIAALNSTSGDMRIAGSFTANLIIKSGGTSSQFLKADGTVDSTSYVPPSRTLTINGVTQDLSASRSFTVTASDPTKLPLSGGTLTGALIGTSGVFTSTLKSRKSQTNGDYTTAALWTESYDDTTTGIAFHISGNQGKFLEMRMNGILYWHGDQVVTNTGTWAINVTGSAGSISGYNNPAVPATGSTIVYRDPSGHIYGYYGFYSYINTTDDVSTGAITHIIAKFGDNYHRSATAAKVQTFLGLGSMAYASTSTYYLASNPSGYISSETDTLASVTNRANSTAQDIVFTNGRKGLVGVYNAAQTQAIFSMGYPYILTDGGASSTIGNFYGLAWSYNPDYGGAGNNPQSKAGLNHQLLLMQAGVTTTALGSGVWTSGNIVAANFTGSHTGTSSGINTGDQTSVSGNAGTVTNGVYTNITNTIVNGDATALILYGAGTYNAAAALHLGGWSTDTTYARIRTSNGNLHLDTRGGAGNAYQMYFNHYSSGDMYFGNGGGTVYIYGGRLRHSNETPYIYNSGTWGISTTGNAATATYATNAGNADTIDDWGFRNTGSNSATAPDTIDSNGISYTGVALLGQTDGALYSQRHSTPWQHQIFGDYRTGQIAVRGKNNGTWQVWRTVLDSTNYVNYAWPLEGSWKPTSLSSSTRLRGATSPDGGEFGLAYSGGQIHPYADGFFYQNEGAYRVIDTNSVGSYAPTLTGGGASGTWAISISGNAATASSVAWGNVTSKPLEIFNYDGWVNSPGYDANTIAGNKSGFTYSNNAPYTGPLTHFAASGYGLQFNASYSGGGTGLAFRTRNGDEAIFNPWRVLLNSANYTAYAPSLTGSGASGTWGISITGNAVTANSAAYASNAGNAASVSSITSNTGLIRDRLAASAYIDALTTANFRTTLFGASTQGYQISTARWNTTPTALPGQNSYGTMIAWAGADTHGFLALDYNSANATLGGGSGDAITWSKKLAFADGTGVSGTWAINITGNATYALNSTRLYASDGSYVYGGAAPYYMYMNYDGGSYWELKVSPATPGTVRVAYANIAGSASVAGTANAVAWANVSGTPTTLAGYGITNALGYVSLTDSFGLNDNKLYLRTKNDNNHYIWNAADDWEEIVAFSGTGLRIASSTGVTLATFTTTGNTMNIIGSASTAAYATDAGTLGTYAGSNFVGKNGNTYYQVNDWLQFNGSYGLYWPSYYGAHLHANDLSNYTQLAIRGTKGGYSGIYDQNSGVHGIMYDAAGNGGVYRQASSRWYLYYNLGNSCMGVNTSTTSASYGMYVGGAIYATGDIVAYSDKRKKTDIVTIDSAISKVKEMRGVFYTRIDDEESIRQVGVIAQEMNEVLPEAVTYASDIDEYGVKYGNIVGVLIEAIKEQQKEIDELKAKLN